MSEGPAGELSAAPAAKRIRRDGDRISLLRWLNRRLDVVNVPLGMKVGDLADRLAATWPLAGDVTECSRTLARGPGARPWPMNSMMN